MNFEPKITQVIEQIITVCTKMGNIDEIILYGSRAKGTHMEKSDLDIALVGTNIDIDLLRDEVDLINTLLKIDLVDIDNCKNERLLQEVKKDGITLYRKI